VSGGTKLVRLLATGDFSAPGADTGAAGTTYFELGGVAFLGKSNRNEPAAGLVMPRVGVSDSPLSKLSDADTAFQKQGPDLAMCIPSRASSISVRIAYQL
jgi:hypothetical protein